MEIEVEADELYCNPLQRLGIPFLWDLASWPGIGVYNPTSSILALM